MVLAGPAAVVAADSCSSLQTSYEVLDITLPSKKTSSHFIGPYTRNWGESLGQASYNAWQLGLQPPVPGQAQVVRMSGSFQRGLHIQH